MVSEAADPVFKCQLGFEAAQKLWRKKGKAKLFASEKVLWYL